MKVVKNSRRKLLGAPMQQSYGSKDKQKFPKCSGPECWCYDCSMDSVEEENENEYLSEKDFKNKEVKALDYACNALKQFLS